MKLFLAVAISFLVAVSLEITCKCNYTEREKIYLTRNFQVKYFRHSIFLLLLEVNEWPIFWVFLVVVTEKYYNCDVYTKEENTTSNHTLCVEDFQEGKFYCKSWECDTPDCDPDQQTTQSDCLICPGMFTVNRLSTSRDSPKSIVTVKSKFV